ncbi:hypothetical protein [Kordiimonas sp. SCSIO 12610]|uniref:hypothetical protein n=1 Tax=Kordiimonas sp. SCSIO 12610 TaxID=2829597 RepID=UPI00210E7267|nr:hypothetical protein [Kordiimonas sp. SCSIO 12610]UTW54813.1 hypothetical protein KFF44_13515 [Kordiimonas sp. SCSIO 12610]
MNKNTKVIDSDIITPFKIEHNVDEIITNGKLEQYYNFIDYHFEKNGAFMLARTYLDDIKTITLDGPFSDANHYEEVDMPDLKENVIAYLRRRYSEIQTQGKDGYQTIRE